VTAVTYLATPLNAHYLGEAAVEAIAAQIVDSRGPSGENADYLMRLHEWLESVQATDEHVRELVEHVRRIQRQREASATAPSIPPTRDAGDR
jgi:cation transport protein ChaC